MVTKSKFKRTKTNSGDLEELKSEFIQLFNLKLYADIPVFLNSLLPQG